MFLLGMKALIPFKIIVQYCHNPFSPLFHIGLIFINFQI